MRSIIILCSFLLILGCATAEVIEVAEVARGPVTPAAEEVVIKVVVTDERFELTSSAGETEEFIYGGKRGNFIELKHREFSRDLEQSELYRKITHDLSESLEFEFQGMKFEVVEATGLYLRYRLLKE